MKSIMEEASSIMEAIQKGWERAGKPQEFSVKVFEDAQTAFFGMRTVKSAKVALFFKEGTPSVEQTPKVAKQSRRSLSEGGYQPEERQELPQPERRERREERPRKQERPSHQKETKPREIRSVPEKPFDALKTSQPPRETAPTAGQRGEWTPEMITWVNDWVAQTLNYSGHPEITFSMEPSRNLLRIDFSSPFVSDVKQERLLFSTFAHLIMSSIRNKFKGDLKHLKVVLNSK